MRRWYRRSTCYNVDLLKARRRLKRRDKNQCIADEITVINDQNMAVGKYVHLAENLYKSDMIGTKHANKEFYMDMPVCDQFALERMYEQVKEADFWDAEDRKKGILWLEKWLQIPKEKSYFQD